MQGFPEKAKSKLDDYGFIQSRPKGEIHANNQQMSKLLHKAIGLGGKNKAPQVLLSCCLRSPNLRCNLSLPWDHRSQWPRWQGWSCSDTLFALAVKASHWPGHC